MGGHSTLVLGRAEIERTMTLAEYIDAVEGAFRDLAGGGLTVPPVVHIAGEGGGFHIKSAGRLEGSRQVAVKVNGNFPDNPRTTGLPTIQGAILLCDGRDGSLLAVMDSIEVTAMRTGAATAVAAKYLAPADASVATVVGCGTQGRVQILSLLEVLPLVTVYAVDTDVERRSAFVERIRSETGVDVVAADDLAASTRASRVIVTCTPSRRPILLAEHVMPGTFIAAVGADDAGKQELEPALMASAKVVVDVLEQCAAIGELHHALDAGIMTRADVAAELGAVVAGTAGLRIREEDVVVFDSTGSAIQDLAAATLIYERARAAGAGVAVEFA